jgi:hypothetical protein
MQGIFDCTDDYLNANIYSIRGSSVIYSLSSTKGLLRGRDITTLTTSSRRKVGAIHWRERKIEILGKAVPWDVLKSSSGGLFSR